MQFRKLMLAMAASVSVLAASVSAHAGGELRIAMTTGDLPTTTGAPTQGLEGMRFAGYPVFEPLVMWDLRKTDGPVDVIPWLAEEFAVDPNDKTKWVFKLRPNVKFHDGSEMNADVVLWNIERYYNESAEHFDPSAAAYLRSRASILKAWEKVDDMTVSFTTDTPTSYFPEIVAGILMASPTHWQAVGKDWANYAKQPSGTGAFKFSAVTRTQLTMVKNEAYWNQERAAKLDKVTLQAMPEATTRLAALMSGQVDWVEAPSPDSIPVLEGAGFEIVTSNHPHVWPYWLKIDDESPFKDARVRQALNYALDREGLVALLNGSVEPATGFWKKGDPRYGNPKNDYKYDPAKARELLKEAGVADGELVKVKVMISTAGSGQILPLPMNELLQQGAKEAGFELEFSVVDFAKMLAVRFNDSAPEMQGVKAMNSSFTTADMMWFFFSFNPKNWANYDDPETVKLLNEYRNTFEGDKTELLAKIHERLVDDAPWAYIVHGKNPVAISSKVKGYTPVQSWYFDLTTVEMED